MGGVDVIGEYLTISRIRALFLYCAVLLIFSLIAYFALFTDIPKSPNLKILLTTEDFKYSENKDSGSDFVGFVFSDFTISTSKPITVLRAKKTSKISKNSTFFTNPVLDYYINDNLCRFASIAALFEEDTGFISIPQTMSMNCQNGNRGSAGEMFGYTLSGNFYGKKGIDLWYDRNRIEADEFNIYRNGIDIELEKNTKITIFEDDDFKTVSLKIRADKTVYTGDDNVIDFYGNVFIDHKDGIIESQKAKCVLKYKNNKRVIDYIFVYDKVKYSDNSNSIVFADEMRYYKDSNIIDAEGNVIMITDDMRSKAPYFVYDINADIGRFITEYEYSELKKISSKFDVDVAKYILYSDNVMVQNKAIRLTQFGKKRDNVNNIDLRRKSKLIIKLESDNNSDK